LTVLSPLCWCSSADGPLLCLFFSLRIGTFTGNFAKIAASGARETTNNGGVAGLPTQIPSSVEQGIILAEQRVLAREQGILQIGIKIITR
jgi:hypothetical protein